MKHILPCPPSYTQTLSIPLSVHLFFSYPPHFLLLSSVCSTEFMAKNLQTWSYICSLYPAIVMHMRRDSEGSNCMPFSCSITSTNRHATDSFMAVMMLRWFESSSKYDCNGKIFVFTETNILNKPREYLFLKGVHFFTMFFL